MLGRLARYLRLCGHDAAYALDRGVETDDAVLTIADREDRCLLTRDRRLANRAGERGLYIESTDIDEQLAECLTAGIELTPQVERCGRCNGALQPVPAGTETPAYAPDSDSASVKRCPDCGQYFWWGSHVADVAERLEGIRG